MLRLLAPGSYRIRAGASDRGYVEEYFNNQIGWDNADFVTIVGSETIGGIDFALDLGATISGRVIDVSTGLPLVDIEVRADRFYDDGQRGYDSRTDGEGPYQLLGVAPGAYRVFARGRSRGYVGVLYDHKLSRDDADPVEVNGSEAIEGIDFGLGRGTTISGRVTDEGTGLPISGIEVKAYSDDRRYDTCTDADGRYLLQGVAPGFYSVRSGGSGSSYIRELFDGKLRWDDADMVTVEGTASVQGIDIAAEFGRLHLGPVDRH